ncbi:conjugal transfer protein [Rhodococcus opacus]|uniref:Conjugal transfer protein n=2 Tax=Rhodococcus opacus TaxID=37919 RepID=A0AAX3YQJ9_RHOOP|nr:conjugal transfer protein [Rhodococcus opacus]WLF51318.1 conjugal transfer protein [Rhodococcus opacus]
MSAPTPPPGYRPVHPLPPVPGYTTADADPPTASTPPATTPHAPPVPDRRLASRPMPPAVDAGTSGAVPRTQERPTPPRPAPSREPAGPRPEPAYTAQPDTPPTKGKKTGNSLRGRATAAFSAVRGERESAPHYDGTTNDDFDVPPIGGHPSHTKSRQWAVRLGIPVGVLLLAAGTTFAVGVNIGSSRVPAEGAISQNEALRFRLSSFPVEQAAVFGQQYLNVCLTRPAASDTVAVRTRTEVLARMATSGTESGCGYSGTSTAEAEKPESIVFTGQIKSVREGYTEGAAAYLTYQVAYDSEKAVEVVVPVWVNDRGDPTLMRVVGNVGFMPSPRLGAPPAYAETRAKDAQLATQLHDQVIAPFMQAWGSSDAQQLNLTLTEDASFAARAGLRGVLVNPRVEKVTVYTARTETGAIHYQSGDEVVAETTVEWTSALSTSKQTGTYQIRLRYVQGKWAVLDVTGSALDPSGGPVPNNGAGASPSSGTADNSGHSGSSSTSSVSPTPTQPRETTQTSSDPFDPAAVPS